MERAMTDETLERCPFCAGPVVTLVGGCRPPEIECRPCGVTMSGRPGGVAQLRDRWNARADASTAQSDEAEAPASETETKWGIYDTHNEEVVAIYDTEAEARVGPLDPRERIVEIRFPKPPRKRVAYMNIYGNDIDSADPYPTREEADRHAGLARIACVRVDCEEGQYDD